MKIFRLCPQNIIQNVVDQSNRSRITCKRFWQRARQSVHEAITVQLFTVWRQNFGNFITSMICQLLHSFGIAPPSNTKKYYFCLYLLNSFVINHKIGLFWFYVAYRVEILLVRHRSYFQKHVIKSSSDHNHLDMLKYDSITAVYTWIKSDNTCHRRNVTVQWRTQTVWRAGAKKLKGHILPIEGTQ